MPASFSQRPTGTEIAKRAWNSTGAAMRAMPGLFLSAGLGAVFVAAALAFVYAREPLIPGVVVSLGNILAWSLLGAPLAVAMHRFILLDETTPGLLSYAPAHTRTFFLWLFVLQLAAAVLDAIGTVQVLLRIVATVAALVLSVNLALIFPAIAIDVPGTDWQTRISQSWDRMQGHFWLFVRATFLTLLPVLGLWILLLAAEAILGLVGRALSLSVWGTGIAVAVGVIAVFMIALGAAIASWMYLWTGDPQAQSAQTATSTVT